MKKFHLFCIGFVLSLIVGCATSPRAAVPPTAPSASADLFVISAVYGSGANFVDVTYRVDEMLRQPSAEFFARPEWLHADPTPGWNKALVIVYELKGRRRIFTTGEGGKVSLERLSNKTKKKK